MQWTDWRAYLDDVAVAGAFGGVIKWVRLKEPWREGVISVFSGAIIARYLGPLTLAILDPLLVHVADDPSARATLSGFIIGTIGIAAVGMVIDLFKARVAKTQGDQK
jgi:hypothetical protein